MRIKQILIVLLGAKGGSCFITRHTDQIKILLSILEHLQLDLKKVELESPESQKIYHEDNILGIFDYGKDFDMNILKSFK
jgi:hypothetical protein